MDIRHFFIAAAILISSSFGLVEIPLSKLGHNYAVNFTIDGKIFNNVVDTGIADLVTYNQSYVSVDDDHSNVTVSSCVTLLVDSTFISFYGETCADVPSYVNLGGGVSASNISFIDADGIDIQNPILHTWKNSTGDMGLSYCYSSAYCTSTSFQQLLAQGISSVSPSLENQTFGLDFRNPNSSIASVASAPSTMQLGGASAAYSNSLTWSQMPSPANMFYHEFLAHDLSFCGINLLGNISRTYPVLIDTGSSCLTLPSELYDHFVGWLDNSTVVSSAKTLPSFSFRMVANNGLFSEEMFIPLAALLIAPGAIHMEDGAPFITIANNDGSGTASQQRLCVLKGADIGHPYTFPAPSIIFGALTLQTLYFAADYATYSLALANKLSPTETSFYQQSRQYCAAPASCIGAQGYIPAKNRCKTPRCDQYFFTEIDVPTQTCITSSTPYYFGIIFLSVIIGMECISFFIGQYSGYLLDQGVTNGSNNHEHRRVAANSGGYVVWWEKMPLYQRELPTNSRYRVGYVTLYVGKLCSKIVDFIFDFAVSPTPAITPAANLTGVGAAQPNNRNNNRTQALGSPHHQLQQHHEDGFGGQQLRQRGSAGSAGGISMIVDDDEEGHRGGHLSPTTGRTYR